MAKSLNAADITVISQSSATVTPFNDYDPYDVGDDTWWDDDTKLGQDGH